MIRFAVTLILGLVCFGILVSLGNWQMRRMGEKEAYLAEVASLIDAAPVAVPAAPDPVQHRFLPVSVRGTFVGDTVRVLVSHKKMGAGYRLITALDTDAGRIMVDRGFIRVADTQPDLPAGVVTVTGNLHWPEERDKYTPDNDLSDNIWFAREVSVLAAHLQADPVLVIARSTSFVDPQVTPLGVGTEGIPNDHLEYVVTWYGLAAVWLLMLGLFLWRMYKSARNL
ncbi:SURF1 family protein [Thalassobius sp. Cn5-15]|uniref:SURF1 family protein n=1 Tax=Thalassobius sp. Cn5-15 TaxID=2917763 RepID=UPI001EF3796A|nr:SURF1 family protein [Thalassobius sp. Cn5-15]MCG7493156.1 SURF1 family protein [Thalassobius sp. Cn5-15]